MGGVRPNASENGQISPSTTVRAARGDGSRPNLTSILQEAGKPRIFKPVWESSGESRLNEVQEHLEQIGVTTPEAFRRLLHGEDTFKLLTERLSHLSNAALIALIDNRGRLVNSTNQWPFPSTDLSDHENFQHFLKNDDKGIYIAKPV